MERLVRLSLRGKVFILSSSTWEKHPESLLAKAFSTEMRPTSLMDGDAYFFNRDAELFERVVLPFYDHGFWQWVDGDDPRMLYAEMEYWGLAPIGPPEPGQDLGSAYHVEAWRIVSAFEYEDEKIGIANLLLNGQASAADDTMETFKVYMNYLRTIALLSGYATKITLMKSIGTDRPQLHSLSEFSHKFLGYPRSFFDKDDRPPDVDENAAKMVPMKKLNSHEWSCTLKSSMGFAYKFSVLKGGYSGKWWCNIKTTDQESSSWPAETVMFLIVECNDAVTPAQDSTLVWVPDDDKGTSHKDRRVRRYLFCLDDYMDEGGRVRPDMPMQAPSSDQPGLFVFPLSTNPGTAFHFHEVDKKTLPDKIEYASIDWYRV
jgi:hypothetical protein